MARKDLPRCTRGTLAPSTKNSVASQSLVWFVLLWLIWVSPLAAIVPLFNQYGIVMLSYLTTSLIAPSVNGVLMPITTSTPWVLSTVATPQALALTAMALHGYISLSLLAYVSYQYPRPFLLHRLLPKDSDHRYIYRRTHVSHMRIDRLRRLMAEQPYTIFVMGADIPDSPQNDCEKLDERIEAKKGRSVSILVSASTTALEIFEILRARCLLPPTFFLTHTLCTSGRHPQDLKLDQTIESLGLQAMSQLYLRVLVPGGAGYTDTPIVPRAAKRVPQPSDKINNRNNIERGKVKGAVAPSMPNPTQSRTVEDSDDDDEGKGGDNGNSEAEGEGDGDGDGGANNAGKVNSIGSKSKSKSKAADAIDIDDSDEEEDKQPRKKRRLTKGSMPALEAITDYEQDVGEEEAEIAVPKKKMKRKTKKKTSAPGEDGSESHGDHENERYNEDGMLVDLEHISVPTEAKGKSNPTADVNNFFGAIFTRPGRDGKPQRVRNCLACKRANRSGYTMVQDSSTARRHMAAYHKANYRTWAAKNNFVSMLKEDIDSRKTQDAASKKQSTLDGHVQPEIPKERTIPYSDDAFRAAAVQWLVQTDQPISALEHPAFENMIDVAARAKNGVKIPNRKATRKAILDLFNQYLLDLKKRLNSSAVRGRISLTCDAWQASNTDGYFAVTAHWIEEKSPNEWILEGGLIGFVRMNRSHHGKRLGQALYKVADRIEIAHKIFMVTCDNASPNLTMMTEFAEQMEKNQNIPFDGSSRRIGCLAHIVNLATQAVISTQSKSPHYNSHKPEDHIPDTRDEVGLIRAISVKERSSSQRKERFRDIQVTSGVQSKDLKTLLIDMKVRWSSTYMMLNRAYSLRAHVERFVMEISRAAKKIAVSRKLLGLLLSADEWKNVKLFQRILGSADKSQQRFSSEHQPALHLGIPALEELHEAWTKYRKDPKYEQFHESLDAGIDKIAEYYDKTGDNDAYVFSIILEPSKRSAYFDKNWDESLCKQAGALAKTIFKERYFKEHSTSNADEVYTTVKKSNKRRHSAALADLSSDEEEVLVPLATPGPEMGNSEQAWEREFRKYIELDEDIPEDMSTVTWWGLNAHRFPTWASLARDYLAIMATSVSSERAFSSAGITITKRRNRLKGDVVEALQGLKCAYRQDLFFRETCFSSAMEEELERGEDDGGEDDSAGGKEKGFELEIELDSDCEEDE